MIQVEETHRKHLLTAFVLGSYLPADIFSDMIFSHCTPVPPHIHTNTKYRRSKALSCSFGMVFCGAKLPRLFVTAVNFKVDSPAEGSDKG